MHSTINVEVEATLGLAWAVCTDLRHRSDIIKAVQKIDFSSGELDFVLGREWHEWRRHGVSYEVVQVTMHESFTLRMLYDDAPNDPLALKFFFTKLGDNKTDIEVHYAMKQCSLYSALLYCFCFTPVIRSELRYNLQTDLQDIRNEIETRLRAVKVLEPKQLDKFII